jgi:hypothetical protein
MLICVAAGVDIGQAQRQVPNPNAGPLEAPTMTVTVNLIGFHFMAPADAGEVAVALPVEVAREFHKLLGDALEGKKSDIAIYDRLPAGMATAG